jgi:hypothetical protein
MTFFDINPAVERIARDPKYFTYVTDALDRGAKLDVVGGDARIMLEKTRDRYDMMVLDAFSSDVIPLHLLTQEALRLYLERLDDDGVLAIHISNRHFDLKPVVDRLAHDAGLVALYQNDRGDITEEEQAQGKSTSDWVVMARRREHLGALPDDSKWQLLTGDSTVALWTDDYTNLLGVFAWK